VRREEEEECVEEEAAGPEEVMVHALDAGEREDGAEDEVEEREAKSA